MPAPKTAPGETPPVTEARDAVAEVEKPATKFTARTLVASSNEAFAGTASYIVREAFRRAGIEDDELLTLKQAAKVVDEHQSITVNPAPAPKRKVKEW